MLRRSWPLRGSRVPIPAGPHRGWAFHMASIELLKDLLYTKTVNPPGDVTLLEGAPWMLLIWKEARDGSLWSTPQI
jgi:hypothetical protein